MGCRKTQNQRKTCKDGMEELETKVARKSIQEEVSKRLNEREGGGGVLNCGFAYVHKKGSGWSSPYVYNTRQGTFYTLSTLY